MGASSASTPPGRSEVYFKCDEPHLVSLAVLANGDVLAGSSGKGILYRIAGPGRASVFYDFVGDEVKSLAVTDAGVVYAIVNEYAEPPDVPRRGGSAGRTAPGPVTTARPKPGKGTLVRFDAQGRPEKMMHHDEFHYTALALDDAGQPYVGTGAEGRVYTVDDAHTVTLVADTDERQIGALSVAGLPKNARASRGCGVRRGLRRRRLPSRARPRRRRRRVDQQGPSTPGCARSSARCRGARPARSQLSTRTGNTTTPDGTWSEWSNAAHRARRHRQPVGALHPGARPLGRPRPTRSSEEVLDPLRHRQPAPGDHDVDAVPKSGPKESKEGLVAQRRRDRQARHRHQDSAGSIDNPDADTLRYRLYYRQGRPDGVARHPQGRRDRSRKSDYDWETTGLPEGKYRVRVEASDELSNPPDQVLKHALESAPVLVDNTPPVIQTIAMAGRKLRVRVVDGASAIARVEVSYDGRTEWRPIAPTDGIFDAHRRELRRRRVVARAHGAPHHRRARVRQRGQLGREGNRREVAGARGDRRTDCATRRVGFRAHAATPLPGSRTVDGLAKRRKYAMLMAGGTFPVTASLDA